MGLLTMLGLRKKAAPTPRKRTADQVRREAALLRDTAKHTMGALSVETHEQRMTKKMQLEAAVKRLEAEADRLEREDD